MTRSPQLLLRLTGLVIVFWSGFGGACHGLDAAGYPASVALNHWDRAIETHAKNHPRTIHIRDDVWAADLHRDLPSGPVAVFWGSPSCTYFSSARGGKSGPMAEQMRSQPNLILKVAEERQPAVIFVENVGELESWGPVDAKGKPINERRGQYWDAWVGRLRALGYAVEWRTLDAASWGAPTHRRRLVITARCDGRPIVWAAPTHGPGLLPYVGAHTCIDWDRRVPTVFGRGLVEATMRRLAEGVRKFVLDAPAPFVVPVGQRGRAVPWLITKGFGERKTQAPRTRDVRRPYSTIVAKGVKQEIACAWIVTHYGGETGKPVTRPLPTITVKDHNAIGAVKARRRGRSKIVEAFFARYLPGRSPTFTLGAVEYRIVDVGMRRPTPRELARCQGFPDSFILPAGNTDAIAMIGNSCSPQMVEAHARANLGDAAGGAGGEPS